MSLASFSLLLGRLGRLNEAFLEDLCRVHGTNPSELRVLAMLRSRGDEPVSPTTISQWIIQSTGGLTATLKRLEQSGHIERIADPDDGRGKLVGLTPKGTEFSDWVLGEMLDRYALALNDVDLEASEAAVRDLLAALERFGGVGSTEAWAFEPSASGVGS